MTPEQPVLAEEPNAVVAPEAHKDPKDTEQTVVVPASISIQRYAVQRELTRRGAHKRVWRI